MAYPSSFRADLNTRSSIQSLGQKAYLSVTCAPSHDANRSFPFSPASSSMKRS